MVNWKSVRKKAQAQLDAPKAEKLGRILLVDDEEHNRFAMRELLRDEYDIETAVDGHDAIEKLESAEFALILTDQRMPGMSGTALCIESARRGYSCVRVIITGFAELEHVVDVVNRAGLYQYLTKPIDDKRLREVVRAAVTHHHLLRHNTRLVGTIEKLQAYNRACAKLLEGEGVSQNENNETRPAIMEPVRREIATVFTRLWGFERYAAEATVEESVALLQSWVTKLHETVVAHGGVVDKHMGDGVMVIFGLEGECSHSQVAHCVQELLRSFQNEREAMLARDPRAEIELSVGAAVGHVVLGALGGHGREELAVIGTAANRAARLRQFVADLRLGLVLGADYDGSVAVAICDETIAGAGSGFSALVLPEEKRIRDFSELEQVFVARV